MRPVWQAEGKMVPVKDTPTPSSLSLFHSRPLSPSFPLYLSFSQPSHFPLSPSLFILSIPWLKLCRVQWWWWWWWWWFCWWRRSYHGDDVYITGLPNSIDPCTPPSPLPSPLHFASKSPTSFSSTPSSPHPPPFYSFSPLLLIFPSVPSLPSIFPLDGDLPIPHHPEQQPHTHQELILILLQPGHKTLLLLLPPGHENTPNPPATRSQNTPPTPATRSWKHS